MGNIFSGGPGVMDAGIATELNLTWLRENGYHYLVKSRLRERQFDPEGATEVKTAGDVTIKMNRVIDAQGQVLLYCYWPAREQKDRAIDDAKAAAFVAACEKIKAALSRPRGTKKVAAIMERIGRAKQRFSRGAQHYEVKAIKDEPKLIVLDITWSKCVFRDVSSLHIIEQALGVPVKRFERPMLGFLSREEMLAVIGSPGKTWISQRDHLLFGLMYNTGARVSEIIGVRMEDVILDGAACVHLMGKGRKRRSLPLWNTTVKEVRAWRKLNPQLGANSALLPNRNSVAMTRDNVAKRLDIAVQTAAMSIPELTNRQISPHCIRHTTAMHMLQSGSSIEEIALWLGHESPATTHQYVEASLAMKEKALARLQEPDSKIWRYHATDELFEFLRTL